MRVTVVAVFHRNKGSIPRDQEERRTTGDTIGFSVSCVKFVLSLFPFAMLKIQNFLLDYTLLFFAYLVQ